MHIFIDKLSLCEYKFIMMNEAKQIKMLIIEKEISGAEIARKIGVDRTAVYHVISGKSKSLRVREAIATNLGLSVNDLWHDSFHKNKAA